MTPWLFSFFDVSGDSLVISTTKLVRSSAEMDRGLSGQVLR